MSDRGTPIKKLEVSTDKEGGWLMSLGRDFIGSFLADRVSASMDRGVKIATDVAEEALRKHLVSTKRNDVDRYVNSADFIRRSPLAHRGFNEEWHRRQNREWKPWTLGPHGEELPTSQKYEYGDEEQFMFFVAESFAELEGNEAALFEYMTEVGEMCARDAAGINNRIARTRNDALSQMTKKLSAKVGGAINKHATEGMGALAALANQIADDLENPTDNAADADEEE